MTVVENKVFKLQEEVWKLETEKNELEAEVENLRQQNQHLKEVIKSLHTGTAIKNERLAGRKRHNAKWQYTYEILKDYFDANCSYEIIHDSIEQMIDISKANNHGSPFTFNKFSKSTYYRFKKIYDSEKVDRVRT